MDIDNVVEQLNKKEDPGIEWNGKKYTREDLRIDDGVHLAEAAVKTYLDDQGQNGTKAINGVKGCQYCPQTLKND